MKSLTRSVVLVLGLVMFLGITKVNSQVVLYKTTNFTGDKIEVTSDWSAASDMSWNDKINSIKVPAGWKVIVYEHAKGNGKYLELTSDWTAPAGWKNIISNITVIKPNNCLNTGETLNAGERLVSANGAYILRMQNDGNLCVYKFNNGQQGAFVWGSMVHGFNGASLIMQTDGNLCVYDGNHGFKWGSYQVKSYPLTNGCKLILTDTGKLNILNSAGSVVWTN